MPTKTDQLSEHVGSHAGPAAILPGCRTTVRNQSFNFAEESRVFFFTSTGEGGQPGRCRIRLALSSTIHSTTSPRSNSMACATAEGKLMYHWTLFLRLISCTLVGKPIHPPI